MYQGTNTSGAVGPFLISPDSLGNRGSSYMTGYEFDTNTERDSISGVKLRNFSFNAGTGGTIVLGGISNGNGYLVVRDSTGGTIVTINNTGINVFNGNITIQNSAGSSIIDPTGLNSQANFQNGKIFNGSVSGGTTSSSSFVDLSGGVLGTLITTRTTNVFFYLMGYGYNNGNINGNFGATSEVSMFDSFTGTNPFNVVMSGIIFTDVTFPGPGTTTVSRSIDDQMVSRSTILSLAAGTHAYKLQIRANNGGTARTDAFEVGFIALGN